MYGWGYAINAYPVTTVTIVSNIISLFIFHFGNNICCHLCELSIAVNPIKLDFQIMKAIEHKQKLASSHSFWNITNIVQ